MSASGAIKDDQDRVTYLVVDSHNAHDENDTATNFVVRVDPPIQNITKLELQNLTLYHNWAGLHPDFKNNMFKCNLTLPDDLHAQITDELHEYYGYPVTFPKRKEYEFDLEGLTIGEKLEDGGVYQEIINRMKSESKISVKSISSSLSTAEATEAKQGLATSGVRKVKRQRVNYGHNDDLELDDSKSAEETNASDYNWYEWVFTPPPTDTYKNKYHQPLNVPNESDGRFNAHGASTMVWILPSTFDFVAAVDADAILGMCPGLDKLIDNTKQDCFLCRKDGTTEYYSFDGTDLAAYVPGSNTIRPQVGTQVVAVDKVWMYTGVDPDYQRFSHFPAGKGDSWDNLNGVWMGWVELVRPDGYISGDGAGVASAINIDYAAAPIVIPASGFIRPLPIHGHISSIFYGKKVSNDYALRFPGTNISTSLHRYSRTQNTEANMNRGVLTFDTILDRDGRNRSELKIRMKMPYYIAATANNYGALNDYPTFASWAQEQWRVKDSTHANNASTAYTQNLSFPVDLNDELSLAWIHGYRNMYEFIGAPQANEYSLVDTGLAQEYAGMHAFQDRRGNYLDIDDETALHTSPDEGAFQDNDVATIADSSYAAPVESTVTSLPPHDVLARISGVAKYDGIARDPQTTNGELGAAFEIKIVSTVPGTGAFNPDPGNQDWDDAAIAGYTGAVSFRVTTLGGGDLSLTAEKRGSDLSPGMRFTVTDAAVAAGVPGSITFMITKVSGRATNFAFRHIAGSVDARVDAYTYPKAQIEGYDGGEVMSFAVAANGGITITDRGDQVKVGDEYILRDTRPPVAGVVAPYAVVTITGITGESILHKQWNTYTNDDGEDYIPVPNRYLINSYHSLHSLGLFFGSGGVIDRGHHLGSTPAISNARLPVNRAVPFPLTGYSKGWHVNATLEFNSNLTCHQEIGFNIDNANRWSASTINDIGDAHYVHSTNPYSIWKRTERLDHNEPPEFNNDTFEIGPENEDETIDRHFTYVTSSIVSDGVPFQLYPDVLYLYTDFNVNSSTSSGQHHRPNILAALPRISSPGSLAVYDKKFFDHVYCNEITLDTLHVRLTDGRNRILPLPDDNQQRGTSMVIKCYYSHKSKHLNK